VPSFCAMFSHSSTHCCIAGTLGGTREAFCSNAKG
jgi:hypothetical protein